MSRIMIKQAQVFPLGALLVLILSGFIVPGYSSISQHMSELGRLDHPVAHVLRICAIVGGASVVVFGVGLKLHLPKAFYFTPLVAITFGVAYFVSGIYTSGPLHGLYGLTMFYVLVPAFFAAELPTPMRNPLIVKLSLLAALLSLCYMWFLFSGLEPQSIRGITQRFGALIIFGWYAFASYWLLRVNT